MTDRELMQMALDALDNYAFVELTDEKHWQNFKRVMEALRVRLTQPEPEPVAWMYNGNLHEFDPSDWAEGEVTPLYTAPPQREAPRDKLAQPEPEGKYSDIVSDGGLDPRRKFDVAPQREWQGLTDEEIKEIVGPWGSLPVDGYTRKLFDQIEAKLKEKNT